ncbi:MAG: hypothetical protein KatS3mg005_0001 [Bryobacteraceae bacterium]|nr:MAG: hypothetical protein KatS3mg005_0001 [Bryobacteraceae bacterium]
MQVRILVSIASAEWSYVPGQIVEMDGEMADTWIGSGLAEPAEPADEAEPEQESVPASRKPKRK